MKMKYDFFYKKWFVETLRNTNQQKVIFITNFEDRLMTDINLPNIPNFGFSIYDIHTFENEDKINYIEFLK